MTADSYEGYEARPRSLGDVREIATPTSVISAFARHFFLSIYVHTSGREALSPPNAGRDVLYRRMTAGSIGSQASVSRPSLLLHLTHIVQDEDGFCFSSQQHKIEGELDVWRSLQVLAPSQQDPLSHTGLLSLQINLERGSPPLHLPTIPPPVLSTSVISRAIQFEVHHGYSVLRPTGIPCDVRQQFGHLHR